MYVYINMEHFFMINFSHRSLGLELPPRIRFLQRMQKRMSADNNIKIEDEETNKTSTNSAEHSEQENNEDNSDSSDIPDTANSEKKQIDKKNLDSLQFGKKRCLVILYYIN